MPDLRPEFPTPVDERRAPFRDLRFLVIDDNPEGRFLVSKTLLRKFPNARVIECQTAEAAFGALAEGAVSLVILHRTLEFDGVALIRELRSRHASVPILMMSGVDRSETAMAAGADAVLTYDEWLMVGNHVAALLVRRSNRPEKADPAQGRNDGLEPLDFAR